MSASNSKEQFLIHMRIAADFHQSATWLPLLAPPPAKGGAAIQGVCIPLFAPNKEVLSGRGNTPRGGGVGTPKTPPPLISPRRRKTTFGLQAQFLTLPRAYLTEQVSRRRSWQFRGQFCVQLRCFLTLSQVSWRPPLVPTIVGAAYLRAAVHSMEERASLCSTEGSDSPGEGPGKGSRCLFGHHSPKRPGRCIREPEG
jgi:hypothetical protein